jgi:UDP-perosamine 4-acetyltransferase
MSARLLRTVILGARQHAKVICAILAEHRPRRIEVIGFLDDDEKLLDTKLLGLPILGPIGDLESIVSRRRVRAAIVGVSCAHMHVRRQLLERIRAAGLETPSVISRHAFVSPEATLGEGCVLNPGVVVNAYARVGDNCVAYSNATIEHECRLGNNVYLGPGVNFSADVRVGDNTFIGTGARVICETVGANVTIGTGAVVVRDVPDHAVVAGVPARVLRIKKPSERERSYRLRLSAS